MIWIRSQDKQYLIDASEIWVNRSELCGRCVPNDKMVSLGKFANNEDAIRELNKICDWMDGEDVPGGGEVVYQVGEDS